ncbi:DNA-binding FadR family transcriptional regulator [Labedella gwakjiensis]|uniref:FadR family transcriptional regulator n=1 Tax=Labedella gwakjiensis TaxID=390269 RepID=A0A2P8GW13_9MICO|nr:FadR/GntR family transcriptional regulator [Labedella gwakjiensis]PSL38157.1 DNA-binding FadR family transcriptional regulator [Labedella gwakjiensis]RUQ87293.1 FadR family transcriptional regulator [Labedella gwakjiensis]
MSDDARAWQLVLRSVEADLLSGALAPGDHLPGERALAADLGVGRSSVREALRVLEVLGLVRTATGSGPSSGAIIVSTPRGGMSALLRLQVAASGFDVSDIVDTRLVLETAVAETLAGRAGVDLGAAEQLLDAMDDASLTPAEFLALDARFHVSLAEAAGNQVIVATMAGLRDAIEGYVVAGAAALPSWPDTAARLAAEHRAILDAIRSGDPASARGVVHDHITGYYAETGLAGPTAAPPLPAPSEGPIA